MHQILKTLHHREQTHTNLVIQMMNETILWPHNSQNIANWLPVFRLPWIDKKKLYMIYTSIVLSRGGALDSVTEKKFFSIKRQSNSPSSN